MGCLLIMQVASAQQKKLRKMTDKYVQYGVASYYGKKFVGQLTSSGDIFDYHKMTAASNNLPLGTYVKVTNRANGKWVVVKVNDRMNYKNHRLMDLSRGAAKKLGYVNKGLIHIKVEVIPDRVVQLFGLAVN